MKSITSKQNPSSATPAFAAPLGAIENESVRLVNRQPETEISRHMLLIRLSEAASRIREEAEQIRGVGFTEPSSRLLRILAETAEEQRGALASKEK